MNDARQIPDARAHREGPRPRSAVGSSTTLVGVLSLACCLVAAATLEMPDLAVAFLLLGGAALPMVIWELAVVKVHRRPSTGLDLALRRPWGEVRDLAATKIVGMGATFGLLGVVYFALRTYSTPDYEFYFTMLSMILPVFANLAPF